MAGTAVLDVNTVEVVYNRTVQVLRGLSLRVPQGQIVALLGSNGAGKSTLLKAVSNLLALEDGAVTGGAIHFQGDDIASLAPHGLVRRGLFHVMEGRRIFEDLTVEENLRFYAGVYDLSPERFAEQRAYVLDMADLRGREHELTANLSVGWRQRLALGTATIHDPELLFLDEPTGGVDPVARRQFWDLLYDLAGRGVTLFVTTHYMDEASHCNQLAFIYRGRLIAEGAPVDIRHGLLSEQVLEIAVADVDGALAWLERADGVDEAYLSGASLHAVVVPDAVEVVTRRLSEGFPDATVRLVEPTLEDVFVNLVARAQEG